MKFHLIILILANTLISCNRKLSEILYYDDQNRLVERYVFSSDSVFVIETVSHRDTICNFYKNERRIKCEYVLSGNYYGPFEIDKKFDGISYELMLPDSGVKKKSLEYSFSRGNYNLDYIESKFRNVNLINRRLIDTTHVDSDILVYKNTSLAHGDDSPDQESFYWIDYVSIQYGVLIKREYYKNAETSPYLVIQGKFLFRRRYTN